MKLDRQSRRTLIRGGFFLLFVLAPPLDLFRFDLNLKHFILFGHPWTLGLDDFLAGRSGPGDAAWNLFWRGFLPIAGGAWLFLWAAWRFGRLYCGWLCPHFSVVELINGLMRRASGKPTLWERTPLPERMPDGRLLQPDARYWPLTIAVVLLMALVWAVTLLTYLLPPAEVYGNLLAGTLTRNQTIFIGAATTVFSLEFLLARHLFCRFGCAVGFFQSFLWMANRKALVVGFDAPRAASCVDCNAACDNVCPMRLKPRSIKRRMFTCTQCTECISACEQVQADNPRGSLLGWLEGECARGVSERDFGRRPQLPTDCFERKRRG